MVTCNADGDMIRDIKGNSRALGVLLDEAVNDRGLAMTSSFTNMVVAGQCLAHADSLNEYGDIVEGLIADGKSFIDIAADRAAELAKGPYNSACFVGSGPLKAVATESGLKLLELTAGKIRTVTESALGLRHGPMAVLDKETLFVCYLSNDECKRKYEFDLLKEIGEQGSGQSSGRRGRRQRCRLSRRTGPRPKDAARHCRLLSSAGGYYLRTVAGTLLFHALRPEAGHSQPDGRDQPGGAGRADL